MVVAAVAEDSAVEGVETVVAVPSVTREVTNSRVDTSSSKATKEVPVLIKAIKGEAVATAKETRAADIVAAAAALAVYREGGLNRRKTTTRATAAIVAAADTVPVEVLTRVVTNTVTAPVDRVIAVVEEAMVGAAVVIISNITETTATTEVIGEIVEITITITTVAEVEVAVVGPTITEEGVAKAERFHDIGVGRRVEVCVLRCI